MRHDETISIRIPRALHDALERERKRMSARAGAELKTSAVIRAILTRALTPNKKAPSATTA